MPLSFFHLVPEVLTADDALPGISTDEATFLALVACLHEAIGTFQAARPGDVITYGDVIHAAKCLTHDVISAYAEDTADA